MVSFQENIKLESLPKFKWSYFYQVPDFKRSLSEDDKRRLHKKKKRDKVHHGSKNNNTIHRKQEKETNLAGVIERLAFQSGDSIEIKPVGIGTAKVDVKPDIKITVDRVAQSISDSKALKPKLKLTFKEGIADSDVNDGDDFEKDTKTSFFLIPTTH